jgi:hypothetical protein
MNFLIYALFVSETYSYEFWMITGLFTSRRPCNVEGSKVSSILNFAQKVSRSTSERTWLLYGNNLWYSILLNFYPNQTLLLRGMHSCFVFGRQRDLISVRRLDILARDFRGSSTSTQAKAGMLPQSIPRQLLSTFLPAHYSVFILVDAIPGVLRNIS